MSRRHTAPGAYGFLAGAYFFLFALLAMQTGCCRLSNTRPQMPTTMIPVSVTQLIMGENGEDIGMCSVWKIGPHHLVTAGHCCDTNFSYRLEGDAATDAPAPFVLVDDDEHDVCVLNGEMKGHPIPLAAADPAVGSLVYTAGYPRGRFLISMGIWSGMQDGYAVSSTVVNPGASGSPVLNSNGEAVGVLVAYVPGMDNISYVAPLEHLRNAVRAARDGFLK